MEPREVHIPCPGRRLLEVPAMVTTRQEREYARLTQISRDGCPSGSEINVVTHGRASAPAHRRCVAIVLLLSLSTSGCGFGIALGAAAGTLGGGVGSAIRTTSVRPGTPPALTHLAAGERVLLHLRDGRKISGRVELFYSRTPSEYAQMYAEYRMTSEEAKALPDLGPVRLFIGQSAGEYPDLARSPGSKLVEYVGLESLGIVVRDKPGARPKFVPFDKVGALSSGEKEVYVRALRNLASTGRVPSLTEIRLTDPVHRIGLNEVTSIETRKGHPLMGFTIGILAFIALVIYTCATANGGCGE